MPGGDEKRQDAASCMAVVCAYHCGMIRRSPVGGEAGDVVISMSVSLMAAFEALAACLQLMFLLLFLYSLVTQWTCRRNARWEFCCVLEYKLLITLNLGVGRTLLPPIVHSSSSPGSAHVS